MSQPKRKVTVEIEARYYLSFDVEASDDTEAENKAVQEMRNLIWYRNIDDYDIKDVYCTDCDEQLENCECFISDTNEESKDNE